MYGLGVGRGGGGGGGGGGGTSSFGLGREGGGAKMFYHFKTHTLGNQVAGTRSGSIHVF